MLYIDIETRSRRDLKKVGVYAYAECTDFEILMAGWAIDNGPVNVAIGYDAIAEIPGLWDPSVTKCAHNAQFERVALTQLARHLYLIEPDEWLHPRYWRDTAALAAENGYPVSLDGAARALRCESKDSAGSRLINLFCKPNRQGGWNDANSHPVEWLDFVDYCSQDVEVLRQIDLSLDWPTMTELDLWVVDQIINDTGFKIDLDMARLAQEASESNKAAQLEEVTRITGVTNPGSTQQLSKWALDVALYMPNWRAETVEERLSEPDLEPDHRRVLELRQELALAAASKYEAALNTVSADGRVRGGFRFFGAHTGRWAGRGLQPHNLPRAAFECYRPEKHEHAPCCDALAEAAIADLKLGLGASQLDLKKLVRALFVGPFTVVDYAAIEARVVAWLAGEQWALDAFTEGRDIYVETAERMGGLTRSQGKVAVLALGYNGGTNSLRAMGAEGDDEELQSMVDVWRRANRKIVRLWGIMQNAIEDGGRVGPQLSISRHGSTMKMHLPSGRAIHYHNVKWEKYRVEDPVTGKAIIKEGWRYDDPKSPRRIGTYGGRLVENATQAVARDLLAEALIRLHDRGYTVAAHVHDEVIVEGEHPVELISKIICEQPDWAVGLPIDGEGHTCQRYRKG